MIKCNLAVLMAERHLKIVDIANATGISKTTIGSLYHNTGKGIQFQTLETLCDFLGVSPGEMLTQIYFYIDDKLSKKINDNHLQFEVTLKTETEILNEEAEMIIHKNESDDQNPEIELRLSNDILSKLNIFPNKYLYDQIHKGCNQVLDKFHEITDYQLDIQIKDWPKGLSWRKR